jgi:hypothetical protein
MEATTAT